MPIYCGGAEHAGLGINQLASPTANMHQPRLWHMLLYYLPTLL